MKLLLVADNPRLAAKVRSALGGTGDCDVTEVTSPRAGLARLDAGERYDVVVADADTVPTGGFALAREVKARGQMGRDVPPVVLLLARSQDTYLSNWSQADAFVVEPVDPFDLAATVRSVVAGEAPPPMPGVGGAPMPSLLDRPAEEVPIGEMTAATGAELGPARLAPTGAEPGGAP